MMARFGLLAIALAWLNACVPTSAIQPVESLSQLDDGSVLLIGRVELNPPLAKDEQKLGSSYEEFRNHVMLVTDTELRAANELQFGDLGRRIDAPMDEFFFVKVPAESFYILRGWVVMKAEVGQTGPGNAPLNGSYRVELRPGDRAVYIGTIRYTRDEFFTTESAIKDQSRQAREALRKQFGDMPLRTSLARPVQ